MKIRKYQKKGKEEVKELILNCCREKFPDTEIEWEDFNKYLVFYVAVDKGKIIGTIALEDLEDKVKLKRLYLHKDYRNKGIVTELLKKV